MTEPFAPQYDPAAIEADLYRRWLDARPLPRRSARSAVAVCRHDAPAERDRRCCTWVTASTTRCRTSWCASSGCAGGRRSGFRAPTTPASRRRTWWSGSSAQEGKTRFDLGRERFEERVWTHVRETGNTILDQLKAIGASCDWSRTYFTLDPASPPPSAKSSCASMKRASSTAATTSSTGAPAASPPSPTKRPRRRRWTARSGTFATRWPTAAASSPSRPRGPRRCWVTPASRCTRTIRATRRWWASRSSCPWWAARSPSSPTTRWTRRSAAAPSRSRPRMIRPTSTSASGSTCTPSTS